jgi:hypothetical protein
MIPVPDICEIIAYIDLIADRRLKILSVCPGR